MKKEYAIINAAINDTERDYEVYFKSSNPQEILNNLKANNYDPETTSIEDYTVDDDGEFYEGSNYDTIDNFISRLEDKINTANKCYNDCENEFNSYLGFRSKLSEIAGAVNANISDSDYKNMWLLADKKIEEYQEMLKAIKAVLDFLTYVPEKDMFDLFPTVSMSVTADQAKLYEKALKMFYFKD